MDRYRLPENKNKNYLFYLADKYLGYIYLKILNLSERLRLKEHSVFKGFSSWWSVRYLFRRTLYLLLMAGALFAGLFALNNVIDVSDLYNDLVLNHIIIESTIALTDFLGYLVGAQTALLAIVFAAIATGFQISASKYSSDISQYIIEKDDFKHLLGIFLFADIFSFTTLISVSVLGLYSSLALLLSYVLAIVTIVYIIGFHQHLFLLYKPLSIFNSIGLGLKQNLEVINIKGRRAKSWTIALNSKENTSKLLGLLDDLYRRLVKNKEYDDAINISGPIVLAIQTYSPISHLKDDPERPWWGKDTQKVIDADDSSYATIKQNFDIKSQGRFAIPSRDLEWFERRILKLLHTVYHDSLDKDRLTQFRTVLFCFPYMMFGDYKNEYGTFGDGNLGLTQKILDELVTIDIKTLDKDQLEVWFEAIFKTFYGLIETDPAPDLNKEVMKMYEDISKDKSIQKLLNTSSGLSYKYLKDYANKLQIEKSVEGELVTSIEGVVSEIRELIEDEIKKFVLDNIYKLIELSNIATKQAFVLGADELCTNIVWAQFRWMNNAMYNKDFDLAELVGVSAKKNLGYTVRIPPEVLLAQELPQEVEKGMFVSLIENRLDLFTTFNTADAAMFLKTASMGDEKAKMRRARKIYFVSLLAFYTSEYYQENTYIAEVIKARSVLFTVNFFEYLNLIKELATDDIMFDSQTYHRWFLNLSNEIHNNLAQVIDPSDHGIGVSMIYDHPSVYIQHLCERGGLGMIDQFAAYDFNEWIEQRKALGELLGYLRGGGNDE